MNDFQFQNTTKVYFGTNQMGNLHEEVLKNGDSILLVYSSSAKRGLVYTDVLKELQENNISVYELGPVEPNPHHTTVNKGVQICRAHHIQTVVAIGGGSTIDCSKAIAATTLSNTDDIWELVEGKAEWTKALAVIAIPTIASTGSEMDKSCVIANTEKGVKSGIAGEAIRPQATFLNPEYTYSVPAKQTACGGFDIMAHVLDMNYFVNSEKYPLQFNVVETLLKTIREQLPIAVKEPENYEARATMLWSASWALNSFCTSGFKTQPQLHILEQFSSMYNMTHGMALAIITPNWMEYLLNKDESVAKDFARFAVNVMGVPVEKDEMETARNGIEALREFIKEELKLPVTFSEAGLKECSLDELLDRGLHGAQSIPRAYRELTREECREIYKMCI